MEQTILGYQYSPEDGRFLGEYSFPNNADQDDIHVPPYTTLEKPPIAGTTEIAVWVNGVWTLKKKADLGIEESILREDLMDFTLLRDEWVEEQKITGKWTASMEAKYQAAAEERNRLNATVGAITPPVVPHNPADDYDYYYLLPEFVEQQKKLGLWTTEMQQRYDEAEPQRTINLSQYNPPA